MTPEQFRKLPKFAQDRITRIERERDIAVTKLNEYVDGQTPSRVWHDELVCTGENQGPTTKRRYFQVHRLSFMIGEREVEISLDLNNGDWMQISCGDGLYFQPTHHNSLRIEPK